MKRLLVLYIYTCIFTACDSENNLNHQVLDQAAETTKMISRLNTIVENTDPMNTRFMNNEKLLILEKMTSLELTEENLSALLKLANEHLYAGNSLEAVKLYQSIFDYMILKKSKYSTSTIEKIRMKLIISNLRVGEQSNCVMLHTSQSCLFPLNVKAVHLNQQGSRQAIEHLESLLSSTPNNEVTLKWLYTIAKQTVGEYPDATAEDWLIPMKYFASDIEMPEFVNIAPLTHTDINDLAGGTILEDFNGDGFIDIMASAWGTNSQLKTLLNDKQGSFVDATNASGLVGLLGGLNMISADYDNDGDIDVLVLRGAWMLDQGRIPNSLLMNDGNGFFTDVSESSNILSFHPTQTAVWGDFDNDGWLDLFIGNESFGNVSHDAEFYHNNKDGTFTDISKQMNLSIDGYVKGATLGDFDNDGYIDLYISRLDKTNLLFRNDSSDGKIRFTDVSKQAGVQEPVFSFPTWFWDYNNDGWLDIFVADFNMNVYISQDSNGTHLSQIINSFIIDKTVTSSPKLFKNNTDGTFTDITGEAELNLPLLAMGANFGDIDNDGYLDMYIGAGDPSFKTLIPNRMFRNNKGEYFQDVTTTNAVGHLQKGHAVSFADIDNDGDQDIYAVMGGAYSGDFFPNALFENPGHGNNWITLRLEGTESNRSAIGARVEIEVTVDGVEKSMHRVIGTGGSFGANSLQLEVGLGKATLINTINIKWPSGIISQYFNIKANQILKIIENNEQLIKNK